jgi:hypothetical protein
MKKVKWTDIAFWLFFIGLALMIVARIFTVHYGVNWLLDELSQTYDFIYNMVSFGALVMIVFAFGVSVQTSQRLKSDAEYNLRVEIKEILEKSGIKDLE